MRNLSHFFPFSWLLFYVMSGCAGDLWLHAGMEQRGLRSLWGLRVQICLCGTMTSLWVGGHWGPLWDVAGKDIALGECADIYGHWVCGLALCSTHCSLLVYTRAFLVSVLPHRGPGQATPEPAPQHHTSPSTHLPVSAEPPLGWKLHQVK